MTAIVDGLYKNGQIELLQAPANLPDGRVRIILIAEESPKVPMQYLTYGKYRTGQVSTLDDFKDAEWRGETESGEPHGQ
jgi:hypothetical protein